MTLTASGNEIADYFALLVAEEAATEALRPRYNIAPSQDVLTIQSKDPHAEEQTRSAEWKRWGLVPSWAKEVGIGNKLFNARSETVDVKPSFRSAFQKRRCLIPANGFYEWSPRNRGHQPFYFEPTEGPLLAFAGLYESWLGEGGEVVDSCTVLTTDAGPDLADVHHRMPVLVPPDQFDPWLSAALSAPDLEALFRPAPAGTLSRRAVSRNVNNARSDSERCLDPAPPPEQPELFQLDKE